MKKKTVGLLGLAAAGAGAAGGGAAPGKKTKKHGGWSTT